MGLIVGGQPVSGGGVASPGQAPGMMVDQSMSTNDMSGMIQGMTGVWNTNSAILLVYSPRRFNSQLIRPMKLKFDEGFVDQLRHVPDAAVGKFVVPMSGNTNRDFVARACSPSWDEIIPINTYNYDDYFQGVLIIDKKENPVSRAPAVRLIYSGYFADGHEPVSVSNLPNALASFHITRKNSLTPPAEAFGGENGLQVDLDRSVMGLKIQELAGGGDGVRPDLYVTTPGDVCGVTKENLGRELPGLAVQTLQPREVESWYNSPYHMLNDIMYAAGQGLGINKLSKNYRDIGVSDMQINAFPESNMQNASPSGIICSAGDSFYDGSPPDENFEWNIMNTMASHLPAIVSRSNATYGLDVGHTVNVGELLNEFPDIKIIRLNRPQESQIDLINQQESNAQTVFSYMVSQAVGSIATSCGLGRIQFQFDSKHPSSTIQISGYNPDWYIYNPEALVPERTSEAMLRQRVEYFKQTMDYSICQHIRSQIGEFAMFCSYVLGGEVQVQLKPLDQMSVYQKGSHVSQDSFNPMVTPNVGSSGTVEANAGQLQYLGTALSIRS